MNKEAGDWHRVAESIAELQLSEGSLVQVNVGGKRVCIGMHKARLFACAASCPHAGGRLADGYIDVQGNLVCPLHRYKFSLANGRNVTGEGYFLKTWAVEEREDGVYIRLQTSVLP